MPQRFRWQRISTPVGLVLWKLRGRARAMYVCAFTVPMTSSVLEVGWIFRMAHIFRASHIFRMAYILSHGVDVAWFRNC